MSEVKKIINPFINHKGEAYNCFGCSPKNRIGFNLEFFYDGEAVYSEWEPIRDYEGYINVVHGGIQATLMDEIASWYVYALLDTAGVTQKMDVDYLKPLYISGGKVKVLARLKEKNDKYATILTEIVNAKGVTCCSAEVVYYLFPPSLARKKYMYPGKENFWE